MATNKGSGGALFSRQKRNDAAPDMGGDITIEGDELDFLIRCAEEGKPVKLEISAWKKRTRDGGSFLSLSAQIPYAVRNEGSGRNDRNDGYRDDRGGNRADIQTTRGTYRSGRGGDDYERRDYGRPQPNHDTQIGGSARDRYPSRGRRDALDDLG